MTMDDDRICNVLIFFALAAAAISWSVKLLLVALVSLGLLFLLTFTMLWRLTSSAAKSPR